MKAIYKITNVINNKCYVGQTSNLERRINDHFSNWNKNHSKQFDDDIKKFGRSNFRVDILEKIKDNVSNKEIRLKELEYIHLLNPEYNTIGKERPPSTRKKLSDSNKGNKQSKETIEKRKESIRKRHLIFPQLNQGHKKKVATNDGVFNSVRECAEYYSVCPSSVTKALKRKGSIKNHKVWYVV